MKGNIKIHFAVNLKKIKFASSIKTQRNMMNNNLNLLYNSFSIVR